MADAPKPPKSIARRFLDVFPDWVSSNLTSSRSLKTWFRAWLAAWAALILLLPSASITAMGNTAFYALLMGTAFIPASAPIQLFLIMLVTAIGGTCMGWALGAAAMRAALAARDQDLLQSTLLKAQESAAGYANPEAVIKLDVFQGLFLDTRASIVYGVFLIVSVFFFGLVRTYAPPLIFFSLFGTIAIDIFCTIGPLFPSPQYLILNSLLISAAMYSAIAIVIIIFVFPQTVNHAYLSLLSRLLSVIMAVMSAQNDILLDSRDIGSKLDKSQTLRGVMFALLRGLKAQAGLLNAEFTWGRMSGEDVAGLQDPLTDIVTRLNALMVFVKLSHKSYSRARGTENAESADSDSEKALEGSSKASTTSIPPTTETYLIQQWRSRHTAIQEEHHLHFSDLLPVLQSATADVRKGMMAGISAVQTSLAFANENRYRTPWTARKDSSVVDSQLDEAYDQLNQALKDFKATKRLELIAPYEAALKSQAGGMPMLPGLHVNYVYSASLVLVAEVSLALMEHVRVLLSQRARNRLWAPTSLRAIAHALTKRQVQEEDKPAGKDEEVPVGQTDYDSYRKDPDTRSVRGPIQRAFSSMRKAYAWSFSPNGLYVLRYCVVTFALWLPAVFKTSAEFYYQEKGVWGLIMAQMTIGYFIGEHLSVYFTRILGTIVGLIVGLLIWYIGNGHGTGNPYGFAASSAVFLAPLMFIRVFVPAKHMPSALILNATASLVIGYSWLNTHLPVVSFGYGWDVAWRRFVLVVVGCVASFLVMFVPPKSARKAVRVRNATAISGLSNVYLALTSAWIGSNGDGRSNVLPKDSDTILHLKTQLISVATQLLSLNDVVDSARWEAFILGEWPYKEYKTMLEVEQDMVAVLALMGMSLVEVNAEWRRKLLHETQIVNPNFISDVLSVFSLVSHSLSRGEPLHGVIPRQLLDRLLYHRAVALQHQQSSQSIGRELGSYEALFYTSAVVSVVQLSQCLDELHAITRRLCGEVPFYGFDEWKNEHQRAHHAFPSSKAQAEGRPNSDDTVSTA